MRPHTSKRLACEEAGVTAEASAGQFSKALPAQPSPDQRSLKWRWRHPQAEPFRYRLPPYPVLSAYAHCIVYLSHRPSKVDTVIISLVQMGKVRPRVVTGVMVFFDTEAI